MAHRGAGVMERYCSVLWLDRVVRNKPFLRIKSFRGLVVLERGGKWWI